MMVDDSLLEKVHALSDLELAVLLCLIGREHCLMSTPPDAIEDLIQELQLVSRKTFGLDCVVIECSSSTTLEDFASALLVQQQTTIDRSPSPRRSPHPESYFPTRGSSRSRPTPSTRTSSQIANVILARNLNRAPRVVQVQALELLRTRRIFTRTSVQTAPKQFIFVPVLEAVSGGEAHVTEHLNDFFSIAYWHDPEDGFVNLEVDDSGQDTESASAGSVIKKGREEDDEPTEALITEAEISQLAKLSQEVQVDIDVIRYQMNIVAFLRMHRAVAEGITPAATKHFGQLIRCLAPLHRLDYVTPALVGLAAKKVYLHRIRVTSSEKERSMQWGSNIEAIDLLLDDVGPEDIIEDVLGMVTAPL